MLYFEGIVVWTMGAAEQKYTHFDHYCVLYSIILRILKINDYQIRYRLGRACVSPYLRFTVPSQYYLSVENK